MPELTIGEAQIDRTVEMVMPTSVRWLFPDLKNGRDLIEQNRDWLAPHFINARGHLLQSIHSLVVRVDGLVVVIDTCVGNDKQREGGAPEWHLRSGPFLEELSETIDPTSVDFVICTHLHVDHVGWNTRLVDGAWQPTFPNARYLFVDRELRTGNGSRQGTRGRRR
jgi:glyoxylase-like metal-dependent hydrolase (beta-lactamase superfamily II)